MIRLTLPSALVLFGQTALADAPRVVTDIAPVHSLVAQVMGDLGAPELLVDPGASPHGYALKPSQARALSNADLVFWIGEPLTPWLDGPLHELARQAEVIPLIEVAGLTTHAYRDTTLFAELADHADDDHHGEEDHHDHEETGHDEAAEDHHHDHDGLDPHAWLDPENAQIWLGTIADALTQADPGNAETYRANAEAARTGLAKLSAEISAELAPVQERPFVVYHDAFQYFEARYTLHNSGAIAAGDANAPSPARIVALRDAIAAQDINCIFSEPQFNIGLVETVFQGQDGKIAEIDPLGAHLAIGPDHYAGLLRGLSAEIAACLN